MKLLPAQGPNDPASAKASAFGRRSRLRPTKSAGKRGTQFLSDLRENPAAGNPPPAPGGNRDDVHVPAAEARAPARAERPGRAIIVEGVADVRTPIDDKRTLFTLPLRFDQLVEMAQCDEAPEMQSEGNHDLGVVVGMQKRVHGQLAGRHVLYLAEEPDDLLVDVAELHLGVVLGEALAGDEPASRDRDIPLEVEDRGGDARISPFDNHELT